MTNRKVHRVLKPGSINRLTLRTEKLPDLEPGELYIVEDGDHSFKVPKRTGKTHDEILVDLADKVADWTKSIIVDRTS